MYVCRCTALRDNIDGGGHSRSCEHTTRVVDTFGLKVAWDEYGMAGTTLVSHSTLFRHVLISCRTAIYS
jgi:hypothetical protein